MNSQPSLFSSRTSGTRHSRAQFSPLIPRATQGVFARQGIATRLAHNLSAGGLAVGAREPVAAVTSEFWWDPHLIVRLHAPLTRYRD